jgi:hypothetical protein
MRVTKGGLINGGMVIRQQDDKFFIVKDKGFGVFITELPIRLTKHQLNNILASYGINMDSKAKIADMKKELKNAYSIKPEEKEHSVPRTPIRKKKASKEESLRKLNEVKNLMAERKRRMEQSL